MDKTRQISKLLIYRNPVREYKGFTMFVPLASKEAYLIDIQGRLVHKWKLPFIPSCDIKLLRNGNLLYSAQLKNTPMSELEGSSGLLLEIDWNGRIVWEFKNQYIHHSFQRLKNENTIFLKWEKVPKNIAEKVKGGIPGTEKNGIMWGDVICEINKYGRVIYEWKAYEHLDIDKSVICPLDNRSEWTHANSCFVTTSGNILVNFMLINTIALINKNTGNIDWSWGAGEIGHPHSVSEINDGNILLFDNGLHSNGAGFEFSRVIEIDIKKKKIVWEYKDESLPFFHSSILGNCQMLGNGNVLICDSTNGRIFEVNREKEIVWEYINPYFYEHEIYGHNNMIVSANRYGVEYPAFRNKDWLI